MVNKTHNNKLLRQIAALQSQIDQYEAEIAYLDTLLKDVGFSDGIYTLKLAASEILEETQTS